MDINFVTVALYIVNVLVLVFAFQKWMLKPVRNFIQKREDGYAERQAQIESAEASARDLQAQAKQALEGVQDKAQGIIDEGHAKAKEFYDHTVADAQNESARIIAKADEEALKLRAKASQDAQGDIVDLAMNIAQRVVEEEINKKDHDRTIRDILEVK